MKAQNHKPVKNQNGDYDYKGFVLAKYENAKGGVRWLAEKDGVEVFADKSTLTIAVNTIDVFYQ